MRIPGDISKIAGIYGNQKNAGRVNKAGPVASKKDVISISSTAKDFQSVLKTLKDIPDFRQEKINELTKKFESGSYNVSSKEVADKIVKSAFDKKA